MPDTAAAPSSSAARICDKCGRRIGSGQFLRAMNVYFCMDCFRCNDCHQIVAERFFPLIEQDGTRNIYCEKDYFSRLDLICHKCGGTLRGPHVAALNRKYHMEHFTCSVCPTVFRQHDAYFEQDGEVFCREHYSSMFAPSCGGCSTPVLNNSVQMRKAGVSEQWHPECYMMYKLWNFKIPSTISKRYPGVNERVLHTLSSFEEATADTLSKMLSSLFNGNRTAVLSLGREFLMLISSLFRVGDSVAGAYGDSVDGENSSSSRIDLTSESKAALLYRREPKQLCKKIIRLFSIFSSLLANGKGPRDEATNNEIVTTVTALARSLKYLIKTFLNGAFIMESRDKDPSGVLLELLSILESRDDFKSLRLEDFSSDQLHFQCLRCTRCGKNLPLDSTDTLCDPDATLIFCSSKCSSSQRTTRVQLTLVSRLEQYSFLLLCGLRRLDATLSGQQNGSDIGNAASNPVSAKSSSQRKMSNVDSVATGARFVTETITLQLKKRIVQELGKLVPAIKEQLSALNIDELPKQSVWDKLIAALNPPRRQGKTPGGVFGVPLDTLMTQGSVARLIGFQNITAEIPSVFDLMVETLKNSNLTVEGLFRRNGNIKRLKEIAETFDAKGVEDITMFESALKDEPPIQLAALLKKFLRELPEPLFPFAFYPMLMSIQDQIDPATKARAMHLLICLLPKSNLNVLIALLFFLQHVAAHSTTSTGEQGNRMDLQSLATVLAPNLLYSQNAAITTQKEAQAAIGVVYGLLENREKIIVQPDVD